MILMENEDITKVHINQSLSSSKILELMDQYPNLHTITCSKSIYNRISKTYIDALNSLDIEVQIKNHKRGRKSKYDLLRSNVVKLAKSGLSAKTISKQLGINISKVYYLIKSYDENFKFNDYKRKYDDDKQDLVHKMIDEGKKPKEISDELDIPLRSVYYILNKR